MEDRSLPLITVGVVADTHVPDRVNRIHPEIIPIFKAARVDRILHAGDISIPSILEELAQVAPVSAVRGNRDWMVRKDLPWIRELELAGVKVALMHGHGSLLNYLRDKVRYFRDGYIFERYAKSLVSAAPNARVIIFGHTHFAENVWLNGRLFFNPGAASSSISRRLKPSLGILRVYAGGVVEGEIIKMTSVDLVNHQWVENKNQS
jgi:putative phosphoesterase